MPTKIKLVNSEKFFLADYTKRQPIEPIIRECYRQFKIPIPEDLIKAKLYFVNPNGNEVILDQTNFNKRYGFYEFDDKEADLIFEP